MCEDLSLEGESFLICIFLIVLVYYTLLFLDVPIALPHNFVDSLYGPFDRRVEIILYVIVPTTIESAFLQQLTNSAPLMRIVSE